MEQLINDSLHPLLRDLLPELILVLFTSVLFLLGIASSPAVRRSAPWIALAGVILAAGTIVWRHEPPVAVTSSPTPVAATEFALYVKLIALLIGGMLVLLQWPTNADASGNGSLELEKETPEYFGLMLLSLMGVLLVASANDLILLFLGIEMASIPTYIMLSISRPIAVAQEATLKYFFLGAFSAALTLFGFTFLFGATGSISLVTVLHAVSEPGAAGVNSAWMILAVSAVVLGLAFKLAAFPLHVYATDVYTGAATPLTAVLSFVPKAAGMVALIKVLYALSGGTLASMPRSIVMLLWVIAVVTMTIGNVLGLVQHNVKRMMACSSISHSGYMLAAVAVMVSASGLVDRYAALQGILFYLAIYGLMNVGIFAVLMMLPAKSDPFTHDGQIPPATSAETLAEIAGSGRKHPGLGLIMAACCFGLTGLPLTAGFFGKVYLLRPALHDGQFVLAIIMVVNAAISAGYYLRIVGTMFLREAQPSDNPVAAPALVCESGVCRRSVPLVLAGVLSALGVVFIGSLPPATTLLSTAARKASTVLPGYRTADTHSSPTAAQTPPPTPLANR